MSLPPLVVAVDVSRTFRRGPGAVVAVHGTTCSLASGAIVALVGSSGSGKSTLLHLLAGLDKPTAGEISWPGLGGHPRSLPPGTVAVVFQNPSLLPTLDAAENVALPLALAGHDSKKAMRDANEVLDRLGLSDVAQSLPEELSGGQAQRVAVARALVTRPRLLLADEPTGQLDHEAGRMVVDALVVAGDHRETALVVATHDLSVADRLPQRWTMSDGRVAEEEAVWSR